MRTQSLRLYTDLGHADVGFVEGQPAVDLVAENDDLVTPARLTETPRDGAVTQAGVSLPDTPANSSGRAGLRCKRVM